MNRDLQELNKGMRKARMQEQVFTIREKWQGFALENTNEEEPKGAERRRCDTTDGGTCRMMVIVRRE